MIALLNLGCIAVEEEGMADGPKGVWGRESVRNPDGPTEMARRTTAKLVRAKTGSSTLQDASTPSFFRLGQLPLTPA